MGSSEVGLQGLIAWFLVGGGNSRRASFFLLAFFFLSVFLSSGDDNAPKTHFETSWGNVSVVVDLDVGSCPDQIRTRRRAGAGSCWRVVAQQKVKFPWWR